MLASAMGLATPLFNQQRPVGPCTPGWTYVQDLQVLFSAQADSHVSHLLVWKFLKSKPGRLILPSAFTEVSEMSWRVPETKRASFTQGGTSYLSQQCPPDPFTTGLAHA